MHVLYRCTVCTSKLKFSFSVVPLKMIYFECSVFKGNSQINFSNKMQLAKRLGFDFEPDGD